MDKIIQYIIVRRDLDMSPGKNGTLTCIGVQPFLKSKIHPLIKRYQLYK